MKTIFSGSDGWGCFVVEVVFNSLCNRLRCSGGKERRMNATIKSR